MIFLEGDIVEDRYRIDSYLRSGGMAEVYIGLDTKMQRQVALKVLKKVESTNTVEFQRFTKEIEAMSRIGHPNIVEIIDYFLTKPYVIVMEYIKGETLKELIKQRAPLILKEFIILGKQLLSAMLEIEKSGIIHRDLKPQNAIVSPTGLLKLLDFGISTLSTDPKGQKDSMAVGTVQYMSPEVVKNERITIQSDIYSMGIIFYEMLLGRVPFRDSVAAKLALMHVHDRVPSINEEGTFHDDLNYIIRKATFREKDLRYKSFQEFFNDFKKFSDMADENNMDLGRMSSKRIFSQKKKIFSFGKLSFGKK